MFVCNYFRSIFIKPILCSLTLIFTCTAIQAKQTVQVGIYDFKPLVYQDQTGKPQGIYVDLLERIAKMEGWDLAYVHSNWSQCLERLEKGKIDLLTAILKSPQREKRFDFNQVPVLSTWGQLYTASGLRIENFRDLEGKRIAVVKKGYFYPKLKQYLREFTVEADFVEVDNYSQVFHLIHRGKVEACSAERVTGLQAEKDFNIQKSPLIYNHKKFLFASPEGDHRFLKLIDKHLESFKAQDGSVYEETLEKHLFENKIVKYIPVWLKWLLLTVSVIAICFLVFNHYLRKLVRSQTARIRKNEKGLKLTLNAIGDAVISTDINGNISRMNPVAENLTGWTYQESRGQPLSEVFKIINSISRKPCNSPVQEVLKTGQIQGLANHTSLIDKEGWEYQIADSASPIQDEQGNITGMVLVFRDVTEKYQQEEALKRHIHDLGERIKELKCLYGITELIEKNDMSVEEIIQGTADLIPPSWQYPEITCARIMFRGKEYLTANFKETIWKQSQNIFAHGEAAGTIEVCYLQEKADIDEGPFLKEERSLINAIAKRLGRFIESRDAKEALIEAKQDFEAIFNNSQVGIMLLRGGRILFRGNQRLADILGYSSPDEMLGISMRQIHLNEESFQEFGRLFYYTLDQGEQIQIEYQLRKKDGSPIWCSLSGKALNSDDIEHGVIWVVDELESRKAMEHDLLTAKESAESANKVKSEFLANMSHEIRTPLNGVIGMLQLLQSTELNDEQKEYIEMAFNSSKRLQRLLSDILDLSKIEADKLEVKEEEFVLSELLQSIQDIFSQEAKKNGNTISVHPDDELPLLLIGDSTRLTQILFNLVGNANKYTSGGQIEVHVNNLPVQDSNSCCLLLSVSDTGKGIPDDRLDEIFETFTQANEGESIYTRQYDGVGLGLPLVKRLINLMGGNASIVSQEGQGTTVYVNLTFRIPDQQQPESTRDAISYGFEQNKYKVLLAEDDQTTQLIIQRLLEEKGFDVKVVGDGQQVLSELAKDKFDCLLMDVRMPKLDGVEATKKIRTSRDSFNNIPIIALTAYAMTGDKEKFLEAGMDDYIAKPLNKDELISVLRRNLSI